jgi:hypothetical protein
MDGRDLLDDWKKICGWMEEILWMIGRRSGGWLEEDMVDVWKKVWWMLGRRSDKWLEEDLVDGWKKIWWMVWRRSVR